jgi:heme-degrading monooxygenase HmoA
MTILGRAVLVAWHDVAEGRDEEYARWHSREHMDERLGIPGFLRARRCAAEDPEASPRYLLMYEVADLAALAAPLYRERLENPTPWTREMMPALLGMNRSLCRVVASHGVGVGRTLLTVRLSPVAGREAALEDALRDELERLSSLNGIVGAHLLRADAEASQSSSREGQLRPKPDAVADWVLMIEGYVPRAVCALRDGPLSGATLQALGALSRSAAGVYSLVHLATRDDHTRYPADR